jgi:NAD(P)-dependent dehydrogenase (short-subunit alcohol dehydrogenase family)
MGWTLDNVLTICELTVFHPITSTLVLGATILFQTYVRPIKFENDFSVIESIWPLSIQTKITLGCAMISWILQLNQIGNRKALNPAPTILCTWPKEFVVVTGGSSGIGGELVKRLERLGATVAILDVVPPTFKTSKYQQVLENSSSTKATGEGLRPSLMCQLSSMHLLNCPIIGRRVHYFKTDVSSFENVTLTYNGIVANLGLPTILVANAGVFQSKALLDASEKDLRTTFDVNVLGALFCIRAFLPSMVAANHGHILVTSSVNACIAVAGAVDYSASKAAVTSIVEGLQTELKHKYGNPKVKVSAIFPAMVNTKMTEGISKVINSFIMPVLEPGQVADRMVQILMDGQR